MALWHSRGGVPIPISLELGDFAVVLTASGAVW